MMLIAIALFILVNTLLTWVGLNLILWTFDIVYAVTFFQAFIIYIVIAVISRSTVSSKQ